MSENNQPIGTLHNLLDYEVSRFTSAEVQLTKSLTEWINNAANLKLKTVLLKYRDFVQLHIQNLEDFYDAEKISSISMNNRVMQAFIEEINEKLADCTDAEIKDACLLAGIQAINHFKISMYGTAAAFANSLEMERQAAVFHEAEINEKQIDDRLTQLADFEVNKSARAPVALPR